MEILDLYTADREKTGRTMVRGEETPAGCYRLVVHVCIFNDKGQYYTHRTIRRYVRKVCDLIGRYYYEVMGIKLSNYARNHPAALSADYSWHGKVNEFSASPAGGSAGCPLGRTGRDPEADR